MKTYLISLVFIFLFACGSSEEKPSGSIKSEQEEEIKDEPVDTIPAKNYSPLIMPMSNKTNWIHACLSPHWRKYKNIPTKAPV